MKIKKLPARMLPYVLPLVISILMSCIVSGVATFKALGPVPDFISYWMQGWAFSWVIAYPTLMVVMPLARRVVFLFVEKPTEKA